MGMKSKTCPKCGKENNPALNQCRNCDSLLIAPKRTANGMILCPYCAEEIRGEAIKCKHCGSNIAPPATLKIPASKKQGNKAWAFVAVLVGIGYLMSISGTHADKEKSNTKQSANESCSTMSPCYKKVSDLTIEEYIKRKILVEDVRKDVGFGIEIDGAKPLLPSDIPKKRLLITIKNVGNETIIGFLDATAYFLDKNGNRTGEKKMSFFAGGYGKPPLRPNYSETAAFIIEPTEELSTWSGKVDVELSKTAADNSFFFLLLDRPEAIQAAEEDYMNHYVKIESFKLQRGFTKRALAHFRDECKACGSYIDSQPISCSMCEEIYSGVRNPPMAFGVIRNTGDKTVKKIWITFYALDVSGRPVTEGYLTACEASLNISANTEADAKHGGIGGGGAKGYVAANLKPGYTVDFETTLWNIHATEWAGQVDAKITDIEFDESEEPAKNAPALTNNKQSSDEPNFISVGGKVVPNPKKQHQN